MPKSEGFWPPNLIFACENQVQSDHCTEFLQKLRASAQLRNAELGPIRPLHGVSTETPCFMPDFLRKSGPVRPLHGVLQNSVLPAQIRCSESGPYPTTARSSAELRAACPALLQQSGAQSDHCTEFLQKLRASAQHRCSDAGPNHATARSSAELRAACPVLLCKTGPKLLPVPVSAETGTFCPAPHSGAGPNPASAQSFCRNSVQVFCPEALVAARDAPGF